MENRFDELLKNKIKDFDLPYDIRSWESLQNKMDAAQSSVDANFDATIRSKLHNNTEGKVDWDQFEKILDAQKVLTNNIFKTKIAEFSLLAIFLMTAWSFNNSSIQNNSETNKPTRTPIEKSRLNTEKNTNKNYAAISPNASKDEKAGLESIILVNKFSDLNANIENNVASNVSNEPDNERIRNTVSNVELNIDATKRNSEELMYPIPTLLPNAIAYSKENVLGFVKPVIEAPTQKGRIKTGFYTGVNMYDVTSEIRSKNVNSGTSEDKTSGYTIGTTIAYNKGNWAIETGLGYNNINYVPLQVEEVPVFNIKELAAIKTHTLQLPLNFKYYLNQNSTIKTYFTAGASLNIALFANYNRDQELYPTVKNNYDEGLLVDGRWKDNFFFATNLGLGVEYKINGFLSAYLQPTAMLHTGSNSLGGYNDRINTFALRAGLKFNL
jgi:Outer membrane protein beta-barrel domain